MKKIVTVKREIDQRIRVYEVPDDLDVKAGDFVEVEFRDGVTAATATQDAIEIEDSIVSYFTNAPLRKVTLVIPPRTNNNADE